MVPLFAQHDVASVAIPEYISWFQDESITNYNLVQLPPIQRNAVWNIAQVERLWDSLLRGFPIGSMLLAHRTSGQSARPLTSGLQSANTSSGFFLLDGQQRTRALLLGFSYNETSRLWIDLAGPIHSGNPEHNDRRFLLRLLTSHQPWGMRRDNPEEKLSEGRKAAERERLPNKPRYDYLISPVPLSSGLHACSWPADAQLPVPLDGLIQQCGGWSGRFRQPTWEQVCQLVPSHYSIPEAAPTHLNELLTALQQLLSDISAPGRVSRSLPLLLHPGDEATTSPVADNVPDAVEVLFRRINAGGTVLAGEEMAYSLLKSSWDKAYELVSQITGHERVGYLFPPTGVVMAAARLARRQQGQLRDLSPSVPQFRRWLSQPPANAGSVSFLQAMQDLLSPAAGQTQARFTHTLIEFCRLALFNPAGSPSDPGLPKKLLLEVNPVLLHPILCWVLDNLASPHLLTDNRLPILRYLLYVLIVKPEAQKFARLALEVAADPEAENGFPDRAIYQRWVEAGDAPRMPSPSQLLLGDPIRLAAGWLSNEWELFGPPEATEELPVDQFHTFRSRFWGHRRLTLWFQRTSLDQWFTGYNPMSQDAADTPYDYDHIVPYSHAFCQGRKLEFYENGEGVNRFYDKRGLYLNSLGNYRAWPAWANRSDGNACHTDKLFLRSTPETSEAANELQLTSATDFLNASAIPAADEELWMAAGGQPGQWPASRRAAWQQAVEQRVSELYQELYVAFDYEQWQEREINQTE